MHVLGIDLGQKRSGLARADELGILIKPLKTILTEFLIDEIKILDPVLLVFGIPKNVEGNKNTEIWVQTKILEIKEIFPDKRFAFVDETCTSKEALAILKAKGIFINQHNKELVDMYSAAIILETYFQNQGY